jgi:hypothetical protein
MKAIVALAAALVAAVSGISTVAGQSDPPSPVASQAMPATSPADGTLKFITHRVGNYRSEAVGAGDFNNDGKLDIIAGAYLYLAPDFKPLKIRSPKGNVGDNGKGYCMDFMNLPLDVDGDGLPDWFPAAGSKRRHGGAATPAPAEVNGPKRSWKRKAATTKPATSAISTATARRRRSCRTRPRRSGWRS